MKYFKKMTAIFLIVLVLTFFVISKYEPVKELQAVVVIDDVILIAVMAGILAVAGYIFYNYDDMAENALFIYANLPEASKAKIDEAVLNGGTTVQVSGALIDNIYGVYWDKLAASGEYLKDAFYGIYSSVVEDFSFVIQDGKLQFINVPSGGGYYTNTSQFPSYDDLKHMRVGITTTSIGDVYLGKPYVGQNIWAWAFEYGGNIVYVSSTMSSFLLTYFSDETKRVIEGVTYYLKMGSTSYRWNNVVEMGICVMAVNNVVRAYVVYKALSGATGYSELWTPSNIVNDYVLDDTNYRWASGSKNIDYGKSASTGVMDRDKTGNEVLGLTGTATRDITIPIDNPQSMLGTNTAGALAGEWADTSEYSAVDTAVEEATATWEEYTGDMKEMSLPAIIIHKFPFCIPFDLAFAISGLVSNSVIPVFEIKGSTGIFKDVDVDIDFTKFQLLATIIRWGVLVMFNIGLIKLTRTIIRG